MNKLLVTCALPYSNGEIHIGHLLEYLQADIWVRFQKMQGNECLFFCADDTHGTPVMIAAQQQNITPQQLVEEKQKTHQQDFKEFEIEFTHYSSTNSLINKKIVYEIFKKMEDNGHIHQKDIKQAFCNHCKMFLPDRFVKGTCPNCDSQEQYGDSCDQCGATYSPLEMKESHCVTCNNPPNLKSSQHLFFKLSNFQNFLDLWVDSHTSQEVSKKLKEWFSQKLKDWDISRDNPYFGFEIPNYPGKFFYVWVDAPIGYIATTQEWCEKNDPNPDSYKKYWQNDEWKIYHFIGKDIIYFHGLFWPAMLQTAGLSTPQQIFAHGFLTINGMKMSKSKKTFINARLFLKYFEPIYLRYYFFSKISPDLNDIDLNWDDFIGKINNELLAKITNIASRCFSVIHKKFNGKLGKLSLDGIQLIEESKAKQAKITDFYQKREFAKALIEIRNIAEETNRYLEKKSPWKMNMESQAQEIQSILTDGLNLFRLINIYLTPVMPSYSQKVADFFKEKNYLWESINTSVENIQTLPYQHLINKIDKDTISKIVEG